MELVVSVLLGLLTFMVGICTFFIKKWVSDIESRLYEHEKQRNKCQQSVVFKDTLQSVIASLSEKLTTVIMRLEESISITNELARNHNELAKNQAGIQKITEIQEKRLDNVEKENSMNRRSGK